MKNFFSALGFDPSFAIDPDAVESAWQERTRKLSESSAVGIPGSEIFPDKGAADLHEARAILSDPARRLLHRLELAGISPGRATTVAPEMMDLFGGLSETLSRTDHFIGRYQAVESRLAKALLTKEAIAVQLELQNRMQTVQDKKQEIIARFPELDARAEQGDFSQASGLLGRLQFLTKWEAQCRERLLSLLEC